MEDFYAGLHPDDREHTSAAFAAALDPGSRLLYDVEYRTIGKEDGITRWLAAKGRGLFDGDRCVRVIGTAIDVTPRKNIEQALRAERDRSVEVLESISDAFYAVDRDWRFTYVNSKTEELWGRKRVELLGRVYWEEFPQAVGSEPYKAHERAMARREVVRRETVSAIFGEWIDVSVNPTADGGLSVYFREISEKKKAEERLRELNATLEQRVAARTAERDRAWRLAQDLLVSLTPNGVLTAVNAAWIQLLGWEEHELAGYAFSEFTHPDDLEETLSVFASVFEAPLSTPYEYRLRHKNGSYRWFAWTAAFEDGAVYASGRDVTERKARQAELAAAEAARREADALYRAYFENTAEALSVVGVLPDGGFAIEELNPAHEALTGLRSSDMRGKRLEEQLPAEIAQAVAENYRRAIVEGRSISYREVADLPAGRRHWDTVLVPVIGEDGHVWRIIGSGRDVSAQVLAEEQLRQSQKLDAMGQLTGGVAHDFNNLLTPIIGSLDMLMTRGVGNERERRLIDGALQSAERAKTLVQRLLAFARRQPLQPGPVDLRRLVGGMAELVASTSGPKVEVRVEMPDDLPPATADANQLEMAVLNLAVNARDAMPEGGALTISGSRQSVRPGHPSKLHPGHYVRLSVSDTGVGMDKATLDRAVEPFFSTKGVGRGTGLGLSMVHGLASQLGGGLTIDSRPGAGTTVALWLPISAVAAEDEAGAFSATLRPAGALGTALLVDDEALVRLSTADMLADLGYEVVEAGSAEEALRLVGEGLEPDLLVTDHLMPGLSGRSWRESSARVGPALPVLIVSGYAEAAGHRPGPAAPHQAVPKRRTRRKRRGAARVEQEVEARGVLLQISHSASRGASSQRSLAMFLVVLQGVMSGGPKRAA
jgi:PAS domain S-box-containing protein